MPSFAASDPPLLPELADVLAAARRLEGHVVTTPLLESAAVNRRLGGRLLIKAESLQSTGSFKFRGAYNALAQLDPTERRVGVVAFSSGNHAQGVAAAAQLLAIPAVIVMPADAPAVKIANTRSYGAEVVLYDRYRESREAIAADIAATRGATVIPPFEERRVIAGQGTAGLEIATQAAAGNMDLDAVIIPCSGGGLAAGCALALPEVAVFTAEPVGYDDMRLSLAAGQRVNNEPTARSICDALLAPTPGEMTFAINGRRLAGGFAVSDADVLRAMAMAFADYRLVVEPGGAAALAVIISGQFDIAGKTVAVIASGGNVDRATFVRALAEA